MNEDLQKPKHQEEPPDHLKETSFKYYTPQVPPTTPIVLTEDYSDEEYQERVQEDIEITPVMKFSLTAGLIMIFLAVASLVMPGSAIGLPVLDLDLGYGLFAGYFPMNIANKMLLVIFGLTGIFSAKSSSSSFVWSRWVMVVMGLGAVLGLIPATQTGFGYIPFFGGEVVAHGVFALFAAYFSYRAMHFVSHSRGFNSAERSVK